MAWLVGAAVWLGLAAASHGLARLLVLLAPVAWLAWRSHQHTSQRTGRPRHRVGWDNRDRQAGWDARLTAQPRPWAQPGPRPRRRRRSRRPGPGSGPGWAGGAAAAGPAWDPDPEVDGDPELGIGIDPETGLGWDSADPGDGPDPGPGGPGGWDRRAWQAPTGHPTSTPPRWQPRPAGARAQGRLAVAPDLVIATATVTGTARLRDRNGQPITLHLQVRGPGDQDLEAVCQRVVTEAATIGDWWVEAWQPATRRGAGGWGGAR
jgi:hypothetical protein